LPRVVSFDKFPFGRFAHTLQEGDAMERTSTSPGYAVLGRLLWMMAGPAVLIITTAYILLQGKGWHTTADYVFFFALAGTVVGRWLEVLGGHPQTCDGEPATRKDAYRYSIVALVAGVALWVLANALGNWGLTL
jgi:hypothetical protein